MRIVKVTDIDICLVPGPWPLSDEQRAAVADYWRAATIANPHLWDGRILGLSAPGGGAPTVETGVLEADEWVVIPAGVAHGFLALDPLDMLYLVTNEYDGSDELGFAWDDPTVGVRWPALPELLTSDGRPILSGRDRTNPTLRDLLARLRDAPSGSGRPTG